MIDRVKRLKDYWTKRFKRLKDYWAKRLKNCWVQGLKNARLKDDRLRRLGGPQEAPRASRSPSRRPTRPHRAGRTQLSGDPSNNFPTAAGALAPQLEDVRPDSGALLAGRLGIGDGTELSDFSRSCSPARASQRRAQGQNIRNRMPFALSNDQPLLQGARRRFRRKSAARSASAPSVTTALPAPPALTSMANTIAMSKAATTVPGNAFPARL